MIASSALILLSSLAPSFGVAAPADAVSVEAPQPTDGYTDEQAVADIEVVLVDRGKAYLEARARLEEHPEAAARGVLARLEAVPAPGPDQRDRLLNVLASLEGADHVEMFAAQLRAAMIHKRPTALWFQLLRRQGEAAAAALIPLVGDRELSNAQRGELLDLLVELTAREALGELMAMVGQGSAELQDRLRRAVIRRARLLPEDSQALAAGIDAGLDEPEVGEARLAQLLILRAACCAVDEAFGARLEGFAADAAAPFQVRVAAIDGLGRLGLGADVLASLAREQAGEALAGSQAAEVLLSLAVEALPGERAGELAAELELIDADAPRLAAIGYRHAALAADLSWLEPSQVHAWPEVRMAALDRVAEAQAGCDRTVTRRLAEIAGPVSERGDEDVRVGRAAVSALGRCGGPEAVAALRELIEDGGVDLSQRAEAGRQLIAHDPEGPDFVAELLLSGAYPDLDRSFADALGKSPAATPQIREALCRTAEANPMVASTAHDSFTALFPGESCEP